MKLITKLTLLLTVLGLNMNAQEVDWSFKNTELSIEERAEILVSQMTLDEKIGQMMHCHV